MPYDGELRLALVVCVLAAAFGCANDPLPGVGGAAGDSGEGGMAGPSGAAGAGPASIDGVGGHAAPASGNGGAGGASGATTMWIVFDSLRGGSRDIYRVRPDGSGLQQLTSDSATDQEPAVSPDGTVLAFSSNRGGAFQVFLMPVPSGTAVALTHETGFAQQPAWSRDGSRLAYSSGDGLVVVNRDGSERTVVARGFSQFTLPQHPAFAPDGALYFDESNVIMRLRANGKTVDTVTDGVAGSLQDPSISLDGLSMAFSTSVCGTRSGIWVVPLGGAFRVCSTGTFVSAPSMPGATAPSNGPDGAIAFETGGSPSQLAVIGRNLVITPLDLGAGDDRNPTWEPMP